jgi:prepilin-type N-terminal cleavage/methylation domain-containing protein
MFNDDKGMVRMSSRAVTLIEFLVVLAILALLITILLPAVQRARNAADRTTCKNNLRQLSIGLQQYLELQKKVPHNYGPNAVGGWSYEILPFVEDRVLFDSLSRGQSLTVQTQDQAHVASRRPLIFTCPTSDIELSQITSIMAAHYVLAITDKRDGFYLSEAPAGFSVPWISGPELPGRGSKFPRGFEYAESYRGKGPHLGGYHQALSGTYVNLVLDDSW